MVDAPLGDAFDVPHELLAAWCGTDDALRAAFDHGGAADTLRPGPVLAAVTERAAAGLPGLSDDELTGVLHAARRLESRAFYLQVTAVAEFARRREAQLEAARARKVPAGCRDGEYPDLELAAELLISRRHAQALMDEATELANRLPRTLAGMADGTIDPARGLAIADATLCLSDADAATADEVLAAGAHDVRADTLARRAAALAMKLDPEAVRRGKEDAKKTRQRVEAGREFSGNARLSGRELDAAEVMAAKANIDAIAARLRNAGLDGTADAVRTRAFLDLLQSRNPFDRLAPAPTAPDDDWSGGDWPGDDLPNDDWPDDDRIGDRPGDDRIGDQPAGSWATDPATAPATEGPGEHSESDSGNDGKHDSENDGKEGEDEGGVRYPAGPGTPAGGLAPLPALVNLIVPVTSLLGWGTAPGQAGSWGLTDPEETRGIVQSASHHPRTRWCVTVVSDKGEAIAHACARGRHPWAPDPRHPRGRGQPPGPPRDPGPPQDPGTPQDRGQPREHAARVRSLLRDLGIVPGSFEFIARGSCDHRHAEDRYTPSRKLKHLIRARGQTCTAPGCGGQSYHADQDHVVPYPDGATCECNLHAPCRAHHRAKQAPGWHVEEPEPGIIRWTLPNGRTHVTRPTVYDY